MRKTAMVALTTALVTLPAVPLLATSAAAAPTATVVISQATTALAVQRGCRRDGHVHQQHPGQDRPTAQREPIPAALGTPALLAVLVLRVASAGLVRTTVVSRRTRKPSARDA